MASLFPMCVFSPARILLDSLLLLLLLLCKARGKDWSYFFFNYCPASCPVSFILLLKHHDLLSVEFKERTTKRPVVTVGTGFRSTRVWAVSVALANTAPGKPLREGGIQSTFRLLLVGRQMPFGFI